VAGLVCGLLLTAPYADRPLGETEALLPAYAAVVLIVDAIAATLLLVQFAVRREVTVNVHRAQVMRKLGAKSLPELARISDRLNAIPSAQAD
jgi:hypothetical protein